VLEAGCGRTTRLAAYRDRIGELTGVDLDADGGRENRTLDRFVVSDLCERLPFGDGAFDLVYANFVIEHLAKPAVTFAEWRRVLRPGGSLVVVTSNRDSPLLKVGALLPDRARVGLKWRGAGAVERDVFPTFYRANTPKLLSSLLVDAGFDPVEVSFVATLHRYAAKLRPLDSVLRASERALPEQRRSTIVAWFRASQDGGATSDPAAPPAS
jgi:SAM-dependent methyltransferase